MTLPSLRELELETLLREKDAQLAEVTDDITVLRQYLSKQPGPSTVDPVTLPPALVSVLLPHIHNAANTTASSSTSTVTAALMQRARVLQEENDELYELLKHSETGKLKDEVRGLRRVVAKLEGALKDSHKAIVSLSTELDKAYETILSNSRQTAHSHKSHSHSHSPRNSYHAVPHSETTGNGNTGNKPPPTEPRAHKRPRLSEPQPSPPVAPPARLAPSLPQKPQAYHHTNTNGPPVARTDHAREHGGRHTSEYHNNSNNSNSNNNGRNIKSNNLKMEVDGAGDDDRAATPPPVVNRDRNRERERERNNRDRERGDRERGPGVKERERDRPRESGKDWDRDGGNKNAHSRRNGHVGVSGSGRGNGNGSGGAGGASGRSKGNERNNNSSNSHSQSHFSNHLTADNASRTLQERLGL